VVTNLNYLMRRGQLNVTYGHRITGGSGLLLGADGDFFALDYTRQLTTLWTGAVNTTFSHSNSLSQTTFVIPGNQSASFSNWFVSASVSRPLGRYFGLSLNYGAGRQTSDANVCANGLVCGSVALRQTVGASLNWSGRPISLE
jgi:hypothetical protein